MAAINPIFLSPHTPGVRLPALRILLLFHGTGTLYLQERNSCEWLMFQTESTPPRDLHLGMVYFPPHMTLLFFLLFPKPLKGKLGEAHLITGFRAFWYRKRLKLVKEQWWRTIGRDKWQENSKLHCWTISPFSLALRNNTELPPQKSIYPKPPHHRSSRGVRQLEHVQSVTLVTATQEVKNFYLFIWAFPWNIFYTKLRK